MRNALRILLVAVAALGLAPAAARADRLDDAAQEAANRLAGEFRKAGYKNVGVLKFEVQKGGDKGEIYMTSGRMNELMATRLENALLRVMASDEYKAAPIGITRGASTAIAKADPKANYRTPEARKALFAHSYKMIWGEPKTVDAFVSGRVTISPDKSKLSVQFRYFDAKEEAAWHDSYRLPELGMQKQFLSDLGYSYVAGSKGLVTRDMGDSSSTWIVPENAAAVPMNPANPASVPLPMPAEEKAEIRAVAQLVDFHIFYDDVEQKVLEDGVSLPTPNEGQRIHFVMTTKEKLAVTVTVNGQNTTDSLPVLGEAHKLSKWVLEPGKSYGIKGFYKNDNTVEKFVAVKPDEAIARNPELADSSKLGQIELKVFREAKLAKKVDVTINNSTYTGTASTAEDANKEQERLNAIPTVSRSIISGGEASVEVVEEDKIKVDEEPVFVRTLTYFKYIKPAPVTSP